VGVAEGPKDGVWDGFWVGKADCETLDEPIVVGAGGEGLEDRFGDTLGSYSGTLMRSGVSCA